MAREARGHEVIIALSGTFPDAAAELIDRFTGILPRGNIRIWYPPRGIAAAQPTPLRDFAEVLWAQFLASLRPDLVHVGSVFEGFGDDVVSVQPRHLQRLPVVATCYDLIPLVRHHEYFGEGVADSLAARWYYRGVQEMSLCEGLLAISEFSRGEAIRHLGLPPERVFNVQAGISAGFHPVKLTTEASAALLERYGLRGSFILYLGAGDHRKNELGLITAYARLPPELRARYQLVIVSIMDPARMRETAAELRIHPEDFVIIPFVRECDLNALYSACALFVLPSLHEGFGLPLGEAMACGAPAIASNVTSLPEVIGRDDATFDPTDPDDIAACMRKVLENPMFRQELATYGPAQAARFTWQSSAARAWEALEKIHAGRVQREEPHTPAVLRRRPRLAFVSRLPPIASAVAEYSANLLRSLARYYDISLVSETRVVDPRLVGAFPQLDPADFLRKSHLFDRVLYQVDNSGYCGGQFEKLLPQRPGIVVLHDVFLFAGLNSTLHKRLWTDDFRAVLLYAHGYPALRFDAEHGRDAALQHYPCSLIILKDAIGVILHSHYEVTLLERYFGTDAARNVTVIPHLAVDRMGPERRAARAALDLADHEFVVCCLGQMTPANSPELLAEAWRLSGLAGRMVFIGDLGNAALEVQQRLNDAGSGIYFIGPLTRDLYDMWLAAADVGVQWHTGSRCESSRVVADALMARLPVIVNGCGSATDLPSDVLRGLPENADASDLAAVLAELQGSRTRRAMLSAAAEGFARRELTPEVIAQRYYDAIERAYASHGPAVVAQSALPDVQAIATLPNGPLLASHAIARSFPSPWRGGGRPRLLVDMSELVRRDHGTGIQRVLREIGRRVLETPPQGWRGDAVRVQDGRLRITHAVPLSILGHAPLALPENPLDVQLGDVLLCADVNAELTAEDFQELQRLQLDGLKIILLVYDLLAVRLPKLFPTQIAPLVTDWYRRMLGIADAAICTARVGADDLIALLKEHPDWRKTPLPIGHFHLGADVPVNRAKCVASAETLAALDSARKRPTIVMVGTIEPRKGHAQVLAAFENLWAIGEDLGLIIVGKQGWNVEELAEHLHASHEMGNRLHWLRRCSDSELHMIYGASAGLLMASRHEGFGLPIAEAAHTGLPVLARDLPVFREIASDNARYFSGDDPQALATVLQRWVAEGFTPASDSRVLTWDDSYRQLCATVLENRWYTVLQPGGMSTALSEPTVLPATG